MTQYSPEAHPLVGELYTIVNDGLAAVGDDKVAVDTFLYPFGIGATFVVLHVEPDCDGKSLKVSPSDCGILVDVVATESGERHSLVFYDQSIVSTYIELVTA